MEIHFKDSADSRLMDYLRVHHDALLLGASTLGNEPNSERHGWDYGIDDEELRIYRQDTIRFDRRSSLFSADRRTPT